MVRQQTDISMVSKNALSIDIDSHFGPVAPDTARFLNKKTIMNIVDDSIDASQMDFNAAQEREVRRSLTVIHKGSEEMKAA